MGRIETKKEELYRSHYLVSWREREIDKDGTLKPFSPEELEHIILLNNHLKALTSAVIDKTLRLSLHALEELHRGNKDFADYDIESSIAMTHNYDCDPMLQDLIEQSWNNPPFSVIMLHANETREEQEAYAAERKELCNNEQAGHGRLWNELWYQHHISLSWAFGHFFNHLSLFTIEDIMKIKPENFETKIDITI